MISALQLHKPNHKIQSWQALMALPGSLELLTLASLHTCGLGPRGMHNRSVQPCCAMDQDSRTFFTTTKRGQQTQLNTPTRVTQNEDYINCIRKVVASDGSCTFFRIPDSLRQLCETFRDNRTDLQSMQTEPSGTRPTRCTSRG